MTQSLAPNDQTMTQHNVLTTVLPPGCLEDWDINLALIFLAPAGHNWALCGKMLIGQDGADRLGLICDSCLLLGVLGVLGGNWVVTFNMWRQPTQLLTILLIFNMLQYSMSWPGLARRCTDSRQTEMFCPRNGKMTYLYTIFRLVQDVWYRANEVQSAVQCSRCCSVWGDQTKVSLHIQRWRQRWRSAGSCWFTFNDRNIQFYKHSEANLHFKRFISN